MNAELLEDPVKRKQEIRKLVQKSPIIRATFYAVAHSEGCKVDDLNVAQANKALEIAVIALQEDHSNMKEKFTDYTNITPFHERGSI